MVYVAYYGSTAVRVFNKEGELLKTLTLTKPDEKELEEKKDFELNPQPFDVAVGIDGTIWVTDGTYFQMIAFSKEGKEIKRIGKPRRKEQTEEDFLVPTFLTVDRKTGEIFMVEAANQRVTRFDKTGKRLNWFGGPGVLLGKLGIPKGIGIDSAGDVAVMDGANVRLQTYDRDTGDLKFVYTNDKKKEFDMGAYAGIAFDGKRKVFFTAEKGLRRVNVWKEE